MKKRRIGLSDLYVSEIGLGCMSLGTDEKKRSALFTRRSNGALTIWIRRICMTAD